MPYIIRASLKKCGILHNSTRLKHFCMCSTDTLKLYRLENISNTSMSSIASFLLMFRSWWLMIVHIHRRLEHGLTNYCPQAKQIWPIAWFLSIKFYWNTECPLIYIFSMTALIQRQSWVIETKISKSKTFTIWSYVVKTC